MFSFVLAFLVKTATTSSYYPVEIPLNIPTTIMISAELRGLSAYYGLSYKKMVKVLSCESEWNLDAYNPLDVTGRAVGVAQFHDDTFYPYAKELGIDSPDIFNPFQQVEVMAYLWSLGEENRWTCTKKVNLSTVPLSDVGVTI